ncbi:MAG: BsaWI family type II restriction enzyme [Actinobacteria bacterium]|nr:BsaWI family type II restriction enzyme [Actinomycetota bacterium]
MDLTLKIKKLINFIKSRGIITEDLKSITIVGKITTAAQELFPEDKDKDFLQIVQETYIKLLTDKGIDPIKARQSWVAASGGDFEGYIRNHINQVLNPKGIIAIKGDRLKHLGKKSQKIKELIKFLTLPAKRRCTQTSVDVWPDNDILVLSRTKDNIWRVLASISVKTSSHSRNTSVLFWSLAIRSLGIKYFLATQDRDNQFIKDCTADNVNQERKLFEAYCDRVFTSNPQASYCSQVKSLILRNNGTSELSDELLELRNQVLGNKLNNESASIEDLENY